ncbi:MAG: diguanylate cyclase, partial [Myxococcota bacterium]
ISSLPPEPDRPPSLLAVASSSEVRHSLEAALASAGYVLQYVSTLSEFWMRVAEGPPDLILIPDDIHDMGAAELCGELRMRQSTRHLAIVAITREDTGEQAVVRSLRAGADDFGCLARPGELSARIAVQLRNNRYRQMLRQIRSERDVLKVAATMDPLTRIPNRRALDRAMAERIERGACFGLLYLDIDHFKRINDELGHEVGDEVLKRLARYLQRGIRSNDYCGRYGGEEFLILVHGADEPLAAKVGERHRRAISALKFDPGGPSTPVTVSIGVAAFDPDEGVDIGTVVRRADQELYQAKHDGRNRVVESSTLPARTVQPAALRSTPQSSIRLQNTEAAAADDPTVVERALQRALENQRAALPVLPEVAAKALRIANDPNADLRRFSALVDRDPHIAARFISIANSVIYSRGIKTTSTNAAIVRVGLIGARDILFQVVYSASAVGLPRYQEAVTVSFRRSVLAAVAARVGSRYLSIRFPYDYLAGLLHDIGEARVYRVLASLPRPPSDAVAAQFVQQYHCRAGVELAEAWNLPEEIVHACGHHHDAEDDSTAVRLVRFADAAVDQLLPSTSAERRSDEPWFERFEITRQQADNLLEEIRNADAGISSIPAAAAAAANDAKSR